MKYNKIASGIAAIALLFTIVACSGNGDQETEAMSGSAAVGMAQAQTMDQSMDQTMDQSMGKLNLNTTSQEDFQSIPDVGGRMAYEFTEYRPWISIQQFRQEIGKYVDEDQVAAFEEYVYVPIDPNESDAATLSQIPGLDVDEATELIANRPFNSTNDFLDALEQYINQEQVSVANSYLTTG